MDQTTLNAFGALGRPILSAARLFLQQLLLDTNPILRDDTKLQEACILKQSEAIMHLPFAIGDFTDFLNSRVVSNTPQVQI
jgi:fumarylacetoacetase